MRVDNLEAVGRRPRKRRDEVAEFIYEKREASIRMEKQMTRARTRRQKVKPLVFDAPAGELPQILLHLPLDDP